MTCNVSSVDNSNIISSANVPKSLFFKGILGSLRTIAIAVGNLSPKDVIKDKGVISVGSSKFLIKFVSCWI